MGLPGRDGTGSWYKAMLRFLSDFFVSFSQQLEIRYCLLAVRQHAIVSRYRDYWTPVSPRSIDGDIDVVQPPPKPLARLHDCFIAAHPQT